MRKIKKIEQSATQPVKRKRVAAYARVSSGKDAQLHSLSAQISYYNTLIGSRGDWELVGIYADEAMTGTKENRPEFQRLLADCRARKIDMVIAKSITRLARNTVTLLETARELKTLGTDIYFEKEHIHTLSSDGELMLTLLASFAQEESQSASENVKWRIRKKFEQGYPTYFSIYGYRFENGVLQVIPEEAKIVKMIFSDFLSGMGRVAIARKLNHMGITTRQGNLWTEQSILHILRGEKYTGNLLLQKTYRLDYINKKSIVNHGEVPMYFVENSHEAIVDKDTFNKAQKELEQRAAQFSYPQKASSPYLFTGLLRCMQCGKCYRRRNSHPKSKYSKVIWICSTFDNCGKDACPSQRIPESVLIEKTSEILAMDEWNRETLLKHIKEIQVPKPNVLVYVFQDGHTQRVSWENLSRRKSWTPEMRQQAREHQLAVIAERRKNK